MSSLKPAILLLAVLITNAHGDVYRKGVEAPSNVTLDAIPVCYDFGCKNQSVVDLPLHEWKTVADWFLPAAETPVQERNQIRQAVGWMEVLIGRYTPTHNDLAFDLPKGDKEDTAIFPGQLDCIDESVNTTVYMNLFQSMGLLKFHRVAEQAYRRSLFDQHWAGQIQEIDSGVKYVVDSWFQPNGHLPVIQKSKDWLDINILTAVVDNSEDEVPVKRSLWHRFLRGE